jgi:predicted transcriptional regulator
VSPQCPAVPPDMPVDREPSKVPPRPSERAAGALTSDPDPGDDLIAYELPSTPAEPGTFDHVRSVRLDAALDAGLRDLATARGQTASDLIRWAVAALVDSGGEVPTVLAAKVAQLNREATDAWLKQGRARRRGDDFEAARHGVRGATLEEAARLVAGHPEPTTPTRPIETADTGGLL